MTRNKKLNSWTVLKLLTLFFILGVRSSMAQSVVNDEVEIQILGSSRIVVDASGQTPQVQSIREIGDVASALDGTETSQCRPYGRKSASRAAASTRIVESASNHVVLELSSSSYAQGGHFRTCPGGCFLGNCVGNHGNDTQARSEGSASATIRVKVPSTDANDAFLLDVGSVAQAGQVVVGVKTPDGREVPRSSEKENQYILSGDYPEAILLVRADTAAQNTGECCNETNAASGLVSVSVERAPVLYSAYQRGEVTPFISLGEATQSYKNVVAIGLNGLIHCSGTLVGRRTILTAAHCVEKYQNYIAAGRMTVSFGSLFFEADKSYTVSEVDFPHEPGEGFQFNSVTYEDDIALIYVAEDVDASYSPSVLHAGQHPTWDEIKEKPHAIIIVGFGFNMLAAEQIGAGIKREAAISADSFSNRSFFFQRSNANTCKGDSGGPSFVEADQSLVLIGVTSKGDVGCTQGTNLRVDAYLPWLTSRIR